MPAGPGRPLLENMSLCNIIASQNVLGSFRVAHSRDADFSFEESRCLTMPYLGSFRPTARHGTPTNPPSGACAC
jgi:hypothetical protein